jgi:hypothetical protein
LARRVECQGCSVGVRVESELLVVFSLVEDSSRDPTCETVIVGVSVVRQKVELPSRTTKAGRGSGGRLC